MYSIINSEYNVDKHKYSSGIIPIYTVLLWGMGDIIFGFKKQTNRKVVSVVLDFKSRAADHLSGLRSSQ